MAGIGFELKKLFVGNGVIRKVRAYAYAAVICSGTMLLAIVLLLCIQAFAVYFGLGEHMREVLVVTMIYALLLSMLLTSLLQMFLSRYVADMVYQDHTEKVIPSFVGASLALMLPGGLLYAGIIATAAELSFLQKFLNWLLFMELIPVWLLMAYITAAKDYRSILLTFLYGVALALLGGPLLVWLGAETLTALMAGLAAGYGFMLVGMLRVLLRYFPRGKSSPFGFIAWFSETPDLVLTGFLAMSGAFVHIVLMWFSPLGGSVTGVFRAAPLFDSAAFYAYLVTLPTSINFIVSVEVRFYTAYREYFRAITEGGTMSGIHLARERMERALWQELSNLVAVQLFFLVVYLLLMRWFLPLIGFTADMLHMFRMMSIGYSLYCIGISFLMLELYFNDRTGALLAAVCFFFGNLAGTLLSLRIGPLFYGTGLIAGGLFMYLAAVPRLYRYVQRIDYHVYCSQPVFNEIRRDRFREAAEWLEQRAHRRQE